MTKNITFSLPAEAIDGAGGAVLLGDFNNWNPEKAPKLEKQSDGSFKTVAKLEEGKTYHYRFLLNNGKWVNDYHAQQYEPAPGMSVDNCVITVPHSTGENKKPEAAESKTNNTKVVKTEQSESNEPVKAKATKKTAANAKDTTTEPSKTKKAKAVNTKVVGEKTEKPAKSSRKTVSKTKSKE